MTNRIDKLNLGLKITQDKHDEHRKAAAFIINQIYKFVRSLADLFILLSLRILHRLHNIKWALWQSLLVYMYNFNNFWLLTDFKYISYSGIIASTGT